MRSVPEMDDPPCCQVSPDISITVMTSVPMIDELSCCQIVPDVNVTVMTFVHGMFRHPVGSYRNFRTHSKSLGSNLV